jgi:sialic acid synthase SpsE
MFVSTGTANLEEVVEAVEAIKSEGNHQVVLLQCTASYPTPLNAANIRAMVTLREATGLPVGLSDHTREALAAPLAAVALGASVVEKHYTLSNRLPGPDHKFALEPGELATMVRLIREVEQALGHGRKELLPEERELHAFARRSVFAVKDIALGETLTSENIAVLRRGNLPGGLAPADYAKVIGKRAMRCIARESALQPKDVG